MMTCKIPIASVNTGPVTLLGEHRGRAVFSGIRKSPVRTSSLYLDKYGLDGDEQADQRSVNGKRIHGGLEKAVYAYPGAHYELWTPELDQDLAPGAFGENLTLDGEIDESQVLIGEEWQWGEALLQVTGPRRPCYKLDMLRGRGTSQAMMRNGRCGWYFRVLTPGMVPTDGFMTIMDRPDNATTVLETFQAKVSSNPEVPDLPDH